MRLIMLSIFVLTNPSFAIDRDRDPKQNLRSRHKKSALSMTVQIGLGKRKTFEPNWVNASCRQA